MSGLSGNPGLPKAFDSNSYHFMWTPELSGLLDDDWVHLNYDSPAGDHSKARRSARTKRSKKKRSPRSKTTRAGQFHGYVLQVIGLVCFIVAAVKSYEPLTGIGFTLVLLGYNKNASKECKIGEHEDHCGVGIRGLTNGTDLSPGRPKQNSTQKRRAEKDSAMKDYLLAYSANDDDEDSMSQ